MNNSIPVVVQLCAIIVAKNTNKILDSKVIPDLSGIVMEYLGWPKIKPNCPYGPHRPLLPSSLKLGWLPGNRQ